MAISPKVNAIARTEIELALYDITALYISQYASNRARLAYIPLQPEYLLHNLEQAPRNIGDLQIIQSKME